MKKIIYILNLVFFIFTLSNCTSDTTIDDESTGPGTNVTGGTGSGSGGTDSNTNTNTTPNNSSGTTTNPNFYSTGTPNKIEFDFKIDVPLGTSITSSTVTLGGFSGLVLASCSNCNAIEVNGIVNPNTAVLKPGDKVAIIITTATIPYEQKLSYLHVANTVGTFFTMTASDTPNVFAFTDKSDVFTSSVITSSTAQLTGTFTNSTVSCGAGCYKISINGGSYAYGPINGVNSGDRISIQMISPSTVSTTLKATVIVGKTPSLPWSVTTTSDRCDVAEPTVGDVCADGTIFAGITPDGSVKMFTTKCDAGLMDVYGNCLDHAQNPGARRRWCTVGGIDSNVDSTTSGLANTEEMHTLNNNVNYGTFEAGEYCRNLNSNGRDDWYLPSSGELQILYTNRNFIGNFIQESNEYYWSSTEYDYALAYNLQFFSGTMGGVSASPGLYKNTSRWFRCVRKN